MPHSQVPVGADSTLPSSRHLPALDGMRGFAVLLVIVHHATFVGAGGVGGGILLALPRSGWVGVDLFFVLSGFLITGILVDEKTALGRGRRFYTRRVFRIFPMYYAALVVMALGIPRWFGSRSAIAGIFSTTWPWHLTFGVNWLLAFQGNGAARATAFLWSVGIEEQFYLLWPLVVWHLSSKRLRRAAVGLAVTALVVRVAIWYSMLPFLGTSNTAALATRPLFTHMDGLALGAWLALAYRDDRLWPRVVRVAPWVLGAGSLGLVALGWRERALPGESAAMVTHGLTLLAVTSAALLVVAVGRTDSSVSWIFSRHWLRDVGKYSYAMYLLHVAVLLTATSSGARRWILAPSAGGPYARQVAFWLFMAAASYIVARMSWALIEKPALRVRDRLAPRPIE